MNNKIFILLFFSNFSYAINIEEAVRIGLKNDFQIKAIKLNTQAVLHQEKASSASFYPKVNLLYGYTNKSSRNPSNHTENSYGGLDTTYNLFNGFSDYYSVNSYEEAYKESKFKTLALQADLKLSIQETYINLLKKQRQLLIKKESLVMLEKNHKDTQAFFNQGLIAKNDLLETKVALSVAKQELLKAQSEERTARETLNNKLNIPLNDDEILEEINFDTKIKENYFLLEEKAINKRSEIKAFNLSMNSINFQRKSLEGKDYPKVDLKATYTRYGERVLLDGRKNSSNNDVSIALTIRINLFDGFENKNNKARMSYRLEALRYQLEALKNSIRLQLKDSIEKYNLARENLNVAQDRVELAKENYYIVEKRYKAHLETTTKLLDARLDLTRANDDFVNAKYNIFNTYFQILRIIEE